MLTADGIFACFIRQGYTNVLAPWNIISPVSGSRRAGRTRGAELRLNLCNCEGAELRSELAVPGWHLFIARQQVPLPVSPAAGQHLELPSRPQPSVLAVPHCWGAAPCRPKLELPEGRVEQRQTLLPSEECWDRAADCGCLVAWMVWLCNGEKE